MIAGCKRTNLSPDANLGRKEGVDMANPILDTWNRRDQFHGYQIACCMHACICPRRASEVNLYTEIET